jgi:hypothetical protein
MTIQVIEIILVFVVTLPWMVLLSCFVRMEFRGRNKPIVNPKNV